MWGTSIYAAAAIFAQRSAEPLNAAAEAVPEFSSNDNLGALATQVPLLLIALGYLYLRRFNFRQWILRPSVRGTFIALLAFALIGLCMDLALSGQYYLAPTGGEVTTDAAVAENSWGPWANLTDPTLVVYSLFNGLYEELFFLGVCLSVAPKYQRVAFIYSLIVRFSFHIYMGTFIALCIGVIVGPIFYLVWKKMTNKNMYPLIIAHMLGDIFGVSLLQFLPR